VPNTVAPGRPYDTWQPDAGGADTNHPISLTDFMQEAAADDLAGWVRFIESTIRGEGLNKQWERWLGVSPPFAPSASAPVFVNGTQFQLSGDWTSGSAGFYPPIAVLGRRVRALVTAAPDGIFGTITASSFAGAVTTVTVGWDSGSLDAGLSEVMFGVPLPGPGNSALPGGVQTQNVNALFAVISNGGSGSAYTGALTPAIAALAVGQVYFFQWTQANPGTPVTVNLNGTGPVAIVKNGSAALAPLDIPAGAVTVAVFDGSNYQILGIVQPNGVVPSATVTNGGSGNAYTGTTSPGFNAYTQGQIVLCKFTQANPGSPVTLALNALGGLTVKKNGGVDLAGGDISAAQELALAYDGTNLQVLGGLTQQVLAGGWTTATIAQGLVVPNGSGVVLCTLVLTAPSAGTTYRLLLTFNATIKNGSNANRVVVWAQTSLGATIVAQTAHLAASEYRTYSFTQNYSVLYGAGATTTINVYAQGDATGATSNGGDPDLGIQDSVRALFIPST
jgi:hypothetical protein